MQNAGGRLVVAVWWSGGSGDGIARLEIGTWWWIVFQLGLHVVEVDGKRGRFVGPARKRQSVPLVSKRMDMVRGVFGFEPDRLQEEILREDSKRLLLVCPRQWGKSTTVAALVALRVLEAGPEGVVVCVGPTLRQTRELMFKIAKNVRAAGKLGRARLSGEGMMEIELENGARVVAVPNDEESVRGFSAPLMVVVDEAAMVSDAVYKALRPMVATKGGALVLLSTPKGQRGFFWEVWSEGGPEWVRKSVRATECGRYAAEVLEEERKALGEEWFRQEFLCEFTGMENGAFLPEWFVRAALKEEEWESPKLPELFC